MKTVNQKVVWVLKHRCENIYYAECYHARYGKIQTICDSIDVAKQFTTKNSAENKAFGKYVNYIALKVARNEN